MIRDITGTEIESCPWQAFSDPFVQEILEAVPWYEKGQLSMYWPRPLHLHIEGLSHYSRAVMQVRGEDQRVRMKQMQDEAKKRGAHG